MCMALSFFQCLTYLRESTFWVQIAEHENDIRFSKTEPRSLVPKLTKVNK